MVRSLNPYNNTVESLNPYNNTVGTGVTLLLSPQTEQGDQDNNKNLLVHEN